MDVLPAMLKEDSVHFALWIAIKTTRSLRLVFEGLFNVIAPQRSTMESVPHSRERKRRRKIGTTFIIKTLELSFATAQRKYSQKRRT